MHEVHTASFLASAEHVRTWTGDGKYVQLNEGFSADHGDDPSIKRVIVRGDRYANAGTTDVPNGRPVYLIDWLEQTRCGTKQYGVGTRGISNPESLKIAQHLEGSTK